MVKIARILRHPAPSRYAAAVLVVAAATGVRFALQPYVGNRLPYLVFFFAVIAAVWHLGTGPSLLVVGLSSLSAVAFFTAPFQLGVSTLTDWIGIALFVTVSLVIVWFAEVNRIVRLRLESEIQERFRAESIILEQVRRAEFGRDIGLALTSSPSLAVVLDRCVGLTIRHLGGDLARIFTMAEPADADRPSGELPTTDGSGPERSNWTIDAHQPPWFRRDLIERIAAERRPYLNNTLVDGPGEADHPGPDHPDPDRPAAAAPGMVALAGCPLVVEDRLVGVWVLFSRQRLTKGTLRAMESVASSLAIGIEGKRAEESRRSGEARKTAILRSALDGIITMDHRGRVLEFNPAAELIFGCPAAAVEGQELAEVLMPAESRPAYRRGLAHYLATGEGPILNRRFEIAARRADGTEFPAEIAVARISIAGPPLFTAHIRDIGDRKQAEEALRSAKSDAEEANQAKDQFLAVLSHELRTPLNPISLTISSILSKTSPDDDLRADLELIRYYVGLEARLIDDLLDVMRIARGKLPLRWEVVDAHRLVEQAVAICAEDVGERALRLSLDLAAPRHAIRADSNRLCQVFWNLIKNAVKFTPPGGSIAIRARNEPTRDTSISQHEPNPATPDAPAPAASDEDWVVEVADSGIGIEPAVLPRIFEAFHQGDSSIVRQYGGLGLGLAICRGIVEGHGGHLAAASPGKGGGATFTARFRALADQPEAAGPAPAPAPREYSPGSPRPAATHFARADAPADRVAPAAGGAAVPQVLVVEDEPATIRLMARLIRGMGYEVTAAATVAEATRHVEGPARFDLIVSDIGLPDGTGLDLMRRVRATRAEVPGIALTGFGTEEDIEQSRRAGFAAHMTKPIDFDQLEGLIRQVVAAPALAP